MSDRIEKAARVIYDATHRDTDPYSVPKERAAEKIARALDAAGMLAPDMREEWTTANSWGDPDTCCGFDDRASVEDDDRPILSRLVSEWEAIE